MSVILNPAILLAAIPARVQRGGFGPNGARASRKKEETYREKKLIGALHGLAIACFIHVT